MKTSYDDASMKSLVVRDMAQIKHAQYQVDVRSHPFASRVCNDHKSDRHFSRLFYNWNFACFSEVILLFTCNILAIHAMFLTTS